MNTVWTDRSKGVTEMPPGKTKPTPLGLKPAVFLVSCGTAKAVPFQSMACATSSRIGAE